MKLTTQLSLKLYKILLALHFYTFMIWFTGMRDTEEIKREVLTVA
jgi:hypothetical protein